jgi:hypothetical protein
MTSTIIKNLVNGISYKVYVTAQNCEGYGKWTLAAPSPLAPMREPGIPTNVKLISLSNTMIKVIWGPPLDNGGALSISKYLIEWDISPEFSASSKFQKEVQSDPTNHSVNCINIILEPSASNWYARVSAFNGKLWSLPQTSSPQYVLARISPPGEVENAVAYPTSEIGIMTTWSYPSSNQCKFCGDGGSSITHYVLEWDDHPDFLSSSSIIVPQHQHSYHIGGRDIITGAKSNVLSPGGTYFIRVIAFNIKGSGIPTQFYNHNKTSTKIGPLQDYTPESPVVQTFTSQSGGQVLQRIEWNSPVNGDGGQGIHSYVVEYSNSKHFENVTSIYLPVQREAQQLNIESHNISSELHAVHLSVEVMNEIQSVRTNANGVDEVQTVTLTCDDVVAEVQTVSLSAIDHNEIQKIMIDADDIDEIQLVRLRGDDVPEIQQVVVSQDRIHEVQILDIEILNIYTNADDNITLACNGVSVGEPCYDIEASLAGNFTVAFELDKCGGPDGVNYCQAAISQYDASLGSISCSPSFVTNPELGGDHCVSLPITLSHAKTEGEPGTLQWALNSLIDDNGTPFMTSLKMPYKKSAVTVSREGRIKKKGSCVIDVDDIAICSGEYEIVYSITFDAYHSTGDVPPVKVINSSLKIDESSQIYREKICPESMFPKGCKSPKGAASDELLQGYSVESIKGVQPIGTISLKYECESKVNKLSKNFTMTTSPDGFEVSFDDPSFLINATAGQWLRFMDNNGINIYKEIAFVDASNSKLLLVGAVKPSFESNNVEYGYYYSDWDEQYGTSGVSNACYSHHIHQTLEIDINIEDEIVSTTDWMLKLSSLPPLDPKGIIVRRHLYADLLKKVGFGWEIIFTKQPGSVNKMDCISESSQQVSCSVEVLQDSSVLSGTFQLGTTWPHEYISESPSNYLSEPMNWNIKAKEMKSILESTRTDNLQQVFGLVEIQRRAYIPPGHNRWSGGYTWTITFTSRPGNIPSMICNSNITNLMSALCEISDMNSGVNDTFQGQPDSSSFVDDPGEARDGNQVSGAFALSWEGNAYFRQIVTNEVFPIQMGGLGSDRFTALSAQKFSELLSINLFGGKEDMVTVIRSPQASQVMGFAYEIQFIHKDVYGDVPPIKYINGFSLEGRNAKVKIEEISKGNEIRGTFQLRFQGQMTRPIAFDATAEDLESALNDLSTIFPSKVSVSRINEPLSTGPPDGLSTHTTQVGGFVWYVTFLSNTWKDPTLPRTNYDVPGNWIGNPAHDNDTWDSGFSKGWGKNVGDMPNLECISFGLLTTNSKFQDTQCYVSELVKGTEPLAGYFKLCLDTTDDHTGTMSVKGHYCTDFIRHNAPASAVESSGDGSSVEEKLEALENIGDVFVTRSEVDSRNGGYTWTIQFLHDADGPCQQKDSFLNLCNSPGNVPKLCRGTESKKVCEGALLLGTCNKPETCSKLTVLDFTDYNNGIRPPEIIERQTVAVMDTNYKGWKDGTIVNDTNIMVEYKLNLNGDLTECIPHNAPAIEVQNKLQSILDLTTKGKVLVTKVTSESDAPNGSIYFVNFYGTGNIRKLVPVFSFDSSICSNGFFEGQTVTSKTILDGSVHRTSCDNCTDGIVQRGNITRMEVGSEGLVGVLPWNASPLAIKEHLEQVQGRHVDVTMMVLDKFGACEWQITFTSNPKSVPPGAKDVELLTVVQDVDSVGNYYPVTVTELVKGSEGLGGTFSLRYESPLRQQIEISFNETAIRLQRRLTQLLGISVFITKDCFPSCYEGGWGSLPVTEPGIRGGIVWNFYLLYNSCHSTLETSDIDLPSLNKANLFGSNVQLFGTSLRSASRALAGDFKLTLHGETTDSIPFNADKEMMERSLSLLDSIGDVSVTFDHSFSQKIQGISASVSQDQSFVVISGDDVRKYLKHGDKFCLINGNSTSTHTDNRLISRGKAFTEYGSPLIENTSHNTSILFVGEQLRIGSEEYVIEKNGIEVQQLSIHNGNHSGEDFAYLLTLTLGELVESTRCYSFSMHLLIKSKMN